MPQIPCDEIFIPNTTTKIFVDSSGVQTQYCIYPDEGFVIHLKRNDVEDFDPITEQTTTTLYFPINLLLPLRTACVTAEQSQLNSFTNSFIFPTNRH